MTQGRQHNREKRIQVISSGKNNQLQVREPMQRKEIDTASIQVTAVSKVLEQYRQDLHTSVPPNHE